MSTIIFHAGLAGVNEREWRTEGEARFPTLLARWNITHHDREPKIQVDTKWEILDVLNSKYLWDTEVKTPSKQQEIQMKIKREVLRRETQDRLDRLRSLFLRIVAYEKGFHKCQVGIRKLERRKQNKIEGSSVREIKKENHFEKEY